MNRFFIDEVAKDNNSITDKEDIKHISKVLRLDIDDEVEIVDKDKKEYVMKIVEIGKEKILLEKIKFVDIKREDEIKIRLYQGIPKGSKMEDICKNTTQTGIFEIVPVLFKRCVSNEIKGNKIQRLQKIAFESAKQCKRTEIPKIFDPISFDDMMDEIKGNDANILLYEDEKVRTIKDFARDLAKKKSDVKYLGIIVGPEGGIDDNELEKIRNQGIDILTLGNRILRTEMAAVVAKSILTYELENSEG